MDPSSVFGGGEEVDLAHPQDWVGGSYVYRTGTKFDTYEVDARKVSQIDTIWMALDGQAGVEWVER